ncbi:MAG: radical SAM protein [Selenomonadaceae bacterium]|nr:radical SAM protein [Selenomonadaceae bacterium]
MDWGYEGSTRRRTCMLMVTHACNLNCTYCYETHKRNAYMSTDLAKEIILREAQFVSESDTFDELEIDFMGGEPFMNFPLIKSVVEWLEQGVISVPWICFATTNGTLLTDEIKAWLREHKDNFILGASYDGTVKMQSTNRGTDKYKLDLDFFREVWSTQPLHMTISKETLPTLAEGVLDMQARGHKVEGGLAEGVDWTIEDALMYREQLSILKDAYLKDTTLTPLNGLSRYVIIYDLPATEKVQQKWCGTGKYMATYDIDGKKYGCHMFTPVVLGKNALLSDTVEWDSLESTADDYCKTCVLRNFCPTCPGFNYKYRGHIAVRDKRWCLMVLAEAITACEFQVERIAAMDKLDEKDAQHGQAALEAYQVLRHLDIEKSRSPYTI